MSVTRQNLPSENKDASKPTIKEKLQQDLGLHRSTINRHHKQAVSLAKSKGYEGETSLEKMTAEEHEQVVDLMGLSSKWEKGKGRY